MRYRLEVRNFGGYWGFQIYENDYPTIGAWSSTSGNSTKRAAIRAGRREIRRRQDRERSATGWIPVE
jgi:3'-phosphoadenosine 5'-phosphosulfate sulfotransferase (PAPS reductase)/FAD synthetase